VPPPPAAVRDCRTAEALYARVVLEDGVYDAIVFDADEQADGPVTVELTILSGEHKGEVVSMRADSWSGDVMDLLGIPATITVTDGSPSVRFEP
jgi:hypothetical protein